LPIRYHVSNCITLNNSGSLRNKTRRGAYSSPELCMPAKKDTKNSGVTIPLNKLNIVYKSDIDILSRNHDCKRLSNIYIVIKFVDPRRINTVAILSNLSS